MKRENVNYLVVGIFVTSLLLLLMVVLYRLAVHDEDTDTYYFLFKNITGIKIGTTVTYGGFRIGSVTGIEPSDASGRTDPKKRTGEIMFKVRVEVKKGWKIPANSKPRIVAPNLLAEQQIDIQEGASDETLKPNSVSRGVEEAGFVAMFNSIAQEVTSVSNEKLRPLLDNLNKQVDDIGSRLSEQIPKIGENVNKLLLKLDQSAERLNDIIGGKNKKKIDAMLSNFKKVSEDLAVLSKRLDQLVARNEQGIHRSINALRKSLETISGRISSIVYNIEQTSRNMSEFSHKIRQNPGLLIGGKSPKERGIYKR